jgi:hypothetical protein
MLLRFDPKGVRQEVQNAIADADENNDDQLVSFNAISRD